MDQQWNEPDRTDYYLMQIAAYLCSKSGVKVSDFKLPFVKEAEGEGTKNSPITKEQATRWAHQKWLGQLAISGVDVEMKGKKEEPSERN